MPAVRGEVTSARHRQEGRTLAVILAALSIPGCVIQEMHDDLAATRVGVERIAELTPALLQTNASIEMSNAQLERLYGELAKTHRSLELVLSRLDSTNAYLQESVDQLRHLDPMMVSLRNLDESLVALRRIVQNIDTAVPLLNLSKGNPAVDPVQKDQEETPHK